MAIVVTNKDSASTKGYRVTDLEQVKSLLPTDILIVASGGKSYQISFRDLVSKLLSDLIYGKLKLGTMAYESKETYAKITHTHDELYNKCDFYQAPGNPTQNSIQVYFNDVNTPITYKSFAVEEKYPTNPKIGTIKFVLKSYLETSGANFDGWKILGSLTLPASTFTEANSQNAFDKSGSNLIVPSFDGYFIKASNQNQIQKVSTGQVGLQPHYHGIDEMNVESLKVKMEKTKFQTFAGSNKGKPHQGKDIDDIKTVEAEVQISSITLPPYNVGNFGTSESPQPKNFEVFVMIYVGNRRHYEQAS